jgi:hypothetical protein
VAGLSIWSDALSPKPAPRVRIVFADDETERVEDDKNKSIEEITRDCIAEARLALNKFEQDLDQRAERRALKPALKKNAEPKKKNAPKQRSRKVRDAAVGLKTT